jgi:hypothetical protein
MDFLHFNNQYLALDRFLQYLFGLDKDIIRDYLMSGGYGGVDAVFLRDWYMGRDNYMDSFLSRTLRASMIPEDVEEIVENQRVIVSHSAREGFLRLENAFIENPWHLLSGASATW